MLFGNSEAEQTPALPESVLPSVSTSSSACKPLTVLFTTFMAPIVTRDVSSTYEKGSHSLCFSYAQDILSNSPIATFISDLPCIFTTPSFFSYWFDGFMPFQCLCALIILTILSDGPFDYVVPKVRLSKYLKYAINCLDLACTKAGLRAAKSIASVAATIAVPSPELLQSVGSTHIKIKPERPLQQESSALPAEAHAMTTEQQINYLP